MKGIPEDEVAAFEPPVARSVPVPVPTFEVGDVVYLLAGGPLLKVINPLDEDGDVECRWFSADGQLLTAFIPTQCLQLAPLSWLPSPPPTST